MLERTQWHLSFDLLLMTRLWKRQNDEIAKRRRGNGLARHRNHPIRGNRGTGVNLPDPAPAKGGEE